MSLIDPWTSLLVRVFPPPSTVTAPRWEEVTSVLGVDLPPSYRSLTATYGRGRFPKATFVWAPVHADDPEGIVDQQRTIIEFAEDDPHERLWQVSAGTDQGPGLLLWGRAGEPFGDLQLYWRVDPAREPAEWTTVVRQLAGGSTWEGVEPTAETFTRLLLGISPIPFARKPRKAAQYYELGFAPRPYDEDDEDRSSRPGAEPEEALMVPSPLAGSSVDDVLGPPAEPEGGKLTALLNAEEIDRLVRDGPPLRVGPGVLLVRKTEGPVRDELRERLPEGSGPPVDWTSVWSEIGIDDEPPEELVWLGREVGTLRLVAPETDEEWSGIDIHLLDAEGVIREWRTLSSARDFTPESELLDEWPLAPDRGGLLPFARLGDDGPVWNLRLGPEPAVVSIETGEQGAWSPGTVTGFLLDVLAGRVEEVCGIAPDDALRLTEVAEADGVASSRSDAGAGSVSETGGLLGKGLSRLRKRR